MIDAHDASLKVVHGDTRSEESLDLSAMQIHGNNAINSHRLKKAGAIRGTDGDARRHFSILSRVPVIRDDNRDTSRRRSVETRHHEKKLHKIVVDGRTRGLDDVHILPPDVLVDHNVDLPVSEAADSGPAEVDAQELGDFEGEAHVAVAAEELESSAVLLGLESGGLEAGLFRRHGGTGLRVGIRGICLFGFGGSRTRGNHGLFLLPRWLGWDDGGIFYWLQHNRGQRCLRLL
mmetsp:Transcript_10223/g.18366  ORF Transcript_10223/g.18366 Transcript_10223/m.18366 type:complete len:233 (+) Transcript_10223:249-947(+)